MRSTSKNPSSRCKIMVWFAIPQYEKDMMSSRKGSYLYTFDKDKYDAKSLNPNYALEKNH
jgi:hypothetical protein